LLDALPEAALARGMHDPDRWEPLVRSDLTLEDRVHFPPALFRFHRDHLSVPG
jgi:hypothetical protein